MVPALERGSSAAFEKTANMHVKRTQYSGGLFCQRGSSVDVDSVPCRNLRAGAALLYQTILDRISV